MKQLSKEELKRHKIITPQNPRYIVWGDPQTNHIRIDDNQTDKVRYYTAQNFIYGQPQHLQETDKYPNYVHNQVWKLT